MVPNQKNLSAELIKSFPIAYPATAREQNEIAETLGIIDRTVSVSQFKKEAASRPLPYTTPRTDDRKGPRSQFRNLQFDF